MTSENMQLKTTSYLIPDYTMDTSPWSRGLQASFAWPICWSQEYASQCREMPYPKLAHVFTVLMSNFLTLVQTTPMSTFFILLKITPMSIYLFYNGI